MARGISSYTGKNLLELCLRVNEAAKSAESLLPEEHEQIVNVLKAAIMEWEEPTTLFDYYVHALIITTLNMLHVKPEITMPRVTFL